MRKITGLLCLLTLLSGCTKQAQKLCEANITETLVNPETAEYHDFRQLTDDEVKDGVLSYAKDSLAGMMTKGQKAGPGYTYYRMRLRAEGAMGDKLTKFPFCVMPPSGDKCECLVLDSE